MHETRNTRILQFHLVEKTSWSQDIFFIKNGVCDKELLINPPCSAINASWVGGMLPLPFSLWSKERVISMLCPASHTGLTSPPSTSRLVGHFALQQRSCLTKIVAGMAPMPTSPRGRLIFNCILLHDAWCRWAVCPPTFGGLQLVVVLSFLARCDAIVVLIVTEKLQLDTCDIHA